MGAYFMMCSCGEITSVKASTRTEAMLYIARIWREDEISKHMRDKHPGEPMPRLTKMQKLFQAKLIPAF